jgi:hypothetical protein
MNILTADFVKNVKERMKEIPPQTYVYLDLSSFQLQI